ncbi:MAG: HD domain-containing protein [Gammaproteobacteria bacterium]
MDLAGVDLLLDALKFAATKHVNQRRKDAGATPYINHPIGLAHVLVTEAGIDDPTVIAAAILHDTIEDTDTTPEELEAAFGAAVRAIVEEVTDDKSKRKEERKRLQVLHAAHASRGARLVKLADKICNLRDIVAAPPANWDLARRREYFDWARSVVDALRGTHDGLERIFDETYRARP